MPFSLAGVHLDGFGVASPTRVAANGVMAAWVMVADQRGARAAAKLC